MEITQNFYNYSASAMKQVLEQSIGKPAYDEKGNEIGIIAKATRIGVETVEFEIDMYEDLDCWLTM